MELTGLIQRMANRLPQAEPLALQMVEPMVTVGIRTSRQAVTALVVPAAVVDF
jgi:hypothetical protein